MIVHGCGPSSNDWTLEHVLRCAPNAEHVLWLPHAYQFDLYQFILFNLFMSAQAAYASPLILMSQKATGSMPRKITGAEDQIENHPARAVPAGGP
jgi:hypothetical protein